MTPVITHNDFHAGDNLIALHLLRHLALQNQDRVFWHFAHGNIAAEVAPVVADIPNASVFSYDFSHWKSEGTRSIDTWKNAHDQWVKSKHRWSWSYHALEHHAWIAARLGFASPFTCREHLLFDYPELTKSGNGGMYFYDFLVINSEPCSGQFKPMAQHGSGYLDDFIRKLAKRWNVITTNPVHGVECTRENHKTLTDIGHLSTMCRNHVMIATGPMWPTLNTTNHHHSAGRKRIAMLDNGEQIHMPGIEQISTREELEKIATKEGWL